METEKQSKGGNVYKNQSERRYNLFLTEREFLQDTLASFYFQSTETTTKKSTPIDVDGERKKLNLVTHEIEEYTRKDFAYSAYCSIKRTKILLNMLLEMNSFDWFATLTFDKERVDRMDDTKIYELYKKYINNIKKQVPNIRYLTVIERHEDSAIHFHILIGGATAHELGLVNSGKVCCSWATFKNGICSKEYFERTKATHELRDTDGLTVYNITSFCYGYTTATRIAHREKCNSYIKKYIDKALGSTDIFKKRFYYSSNLNVPNVVKRLIGADFDEPLQIDQMPQIMNHDYVKHAKQQRIGDCNVLQTRIDNTIKLLLKERKS